MIHVIFLGFFLVMSLFSFFTMGHDKSAAKNNKRRVPEHKLWKLAIFGGGVGAYLGMVFFRHKTKHMNFRIGFTLLAIVQIVFIVWGTPLLKNISLN